MGIWELQDKVNCYEKQISDMQEHIDCLKAELRDVQFYSDKLKQELEMKDGTKMFEALMENSSGEAKELLARHLYENLRCEINTEPCPDGFPLSPEPIEVARELIYANESYMDLLGGKCQGEIYDVGDLRQIAEHLLVYCNNNKAE